MVLLPVLLILGLLHFSIGTVHCFYPNESILIYGRNSTGELRLWPLQSGQSPTCASLKNGGTFVLESLYYTISEKFSKLDLSQPLVLNFACTDSHRCESIIRNANSFSYKLSSTAASNQGIIGGSIKSLQRYNFIYHECWSDPILLYTDSVIRSNYGLCVSVIPTPCRAPDGSLNAVTAEILLTINGTSYNLPVGQSSKGNGVFSLPFNHMKTKYYCHTCLAETKGKDLELCKKVADLVRQSTDFEATLVVNIPYTNPDTGILAPLRYTTDVPIKGGMYYANCFKNPLTTLLWDRVSISMIQNEVASNCANPPATDSIYYNLILIVENLSGNTSELHFRHKTVDFVWNTDRYWFLCRNNQTCLSTLHDAYTQTHKVTGYLMVEFRDTDNLLLDDFTIWLTPIYNCFRLVDLFVTKTELRIITQTQPNYCADQYKLFVGAQIYKLHVFENLLEDLEYISLLTLGTFSQTITNWTTREPLIYTCSMYNSADSDNLCRDVLARVYKLARTGKVIATFIIDNYSTAIGRVYRADYTPIYITASVIGVCIAIAGSIYIILIIRRHNTIIKSICSDVQPELIK